ncbi:ABC transporter permease [Roseivirga thermotolerans]|uniref:ABC transporter permease n=1 Tax=Roseivirga thermotolerans TaxID=1758176 RepID=UPI00273FDAEB|nr:ABC transporter permease [Roseivirga thermotolerans]
MVKNNIIYALRHFRNQKIFAGINVLGFSMSMVACFLIFSYVRFEKSYDNYHTDAERLYRIFRVEEGEAWNDGVASVFPGMTPAIRERVPEVEHIGRLIHHDKIFSSFALTHYFSEGTGRTFNIDKGFFADKDLLWVFEHRWVEGNAQQAMNSPESVIISRSLKEKFFGEDAALGKTLQFKNMGINYSISGVFEDIPENSHVSYEILLPIASLPKEWNLDGDFGWGNFYTYMKLAESSDQATVEQKINSAFEGTEGEWFAEVGVKFGLQNIRDIHLTSHHAFELEANGNTTTIAFLALIGVFIMVMAWVNYVNLSSSKLLDRAREAGVRKVLGGLRSQLVMQHLTETLLINVCAMVVALTVLQLANTWFESLLGIPLTPFDKSQIGVTLLFMMLFTLGSVAFGSYPAWLYAGQKISVVLKGRSKNSLSGLRLRRVLTVFQYIVAVVLLIATLVVRQQLNFMQNQSLGFSMDNRLAVKKPFVPEQERETLRGNFINTLNELPGVQGVTQTTEVPGYEITRMRSVASGPGEDAPSAYLKEIAVDEHYFDVLGIPILHGRHFRPNRADSEGIILSLKAAQKLFSMENPSAKVGQRIYYEGSPYTLVGIAGDVNQMSLKQDSEPFIYTNHNRVKYFLIQLNTPVSSALMDSLEEAFDTSFEASHFDYFFLDTFFDRQYKADRLFGQIFELFSLLAIVVTSLGLFGLSLYNVTQRSKELSIRKVLGAGARHIFVLLTKEYGQLLLIASIISLPLGYLFSNQWLDGFAYRTSVSATSFVLPVILIFVLSIATVSYQIMKAVVANPANTLRDE